MQEFKLYNRAMHVFSEANRVHQFKTFCDNPDADAIQKLAKLMNDSHNSCRDLYECSCPELDSLVNICLWVELVSHILLFFDWFQGD